MRIGYNDPMPTFIDEFGSFGWNDHAAPHQTHFTLTAEWFETAEQAVACEQVITGVRAALGMSPDDEFHFTDANNNQRNKFIQAVSACQFQYVTCTLKKWRDGKWLEGRNWRKRQYFFERIIEPVVASLEEYLRIAEARKGRALCERVTHDPHTDPIYKQTLRDKFYGPKAPSGRSLVNKVRPGKKSDSLVQLADMVCGGYAHSFAASDQYVKLLKPREIAHIVIP